MYIEHLDVDQPLAGNPQLAEDILALARLWRQIGNHPEDDPESLQSCMRGLEYYVSRSPSAELIGAVSIMDCKRGLAKIDSLAVLPQYQGRGHGRALVRAAISHCFDRGTTQIMTTALPAAQPVFASLGFETFEMYETGNASMFLDR